MAKTGVVTGDKEIDAKLKMLEPNLQKKLYRKSLRKGAKVVQADAKRIINNEARDTGAYEQSIVVRAMKRSRKRIGVSVLSDFKKYFKAYEARYGKPPHPAKGEAEPFPVPVAKEFGSDTEEAVKPLRRATYDNQDVVVGAVRADLQELIRETAAK